MAEENPVAQRQTAVTAYFTCKLLLMFVFAADVAEFELLTSCCGRIRGKQQ